MLTPFVADTIMKKKKFNIKKLYRKFPDGLHPGEPLCKDWGDKISYKIDKNFARSMEMLADAHQKKRKGEENDSEPSGKRKWKSY